MIINIALARALQVFTKDSALRAYLEAHDPKALEQARQALADAGIDPDPVDPRAVAPLCFTDICRNAACPHRVTASGGRWFITMGHPGFNSPANNQDGYATQAAALAACRSYATR